MTYLTNPPQAIPAPIRNFVAVEERVSILLNQAGSSRYNPVVGSNRANSPSIPSYELTEGAAFSLRFAIAEASESVTYAVVQHIDDENLALSPAIDIKSSFVVDTATMRFTANLIAGIHLTSSSVSSKNLVTIKTSLNRHIQQIVYAQDAPENMVTVGGRVTTSDSPYIFTGTAAITGLETFNIPLSFFTTWNDEIGRQHGSTEVALTGNISKPYGGMETVEIVSVINYPNSVLLAETEISKVSSFPYLPLSPSDVGIVCRFRSKKGSSETVIGFAYLRFADPCVDATSEDDPPSGSDSSGGVITGDPGVVILVDDMGTDSSGLANTTMNIVLSGYKGGVRDSSGTATAYAGIDSGSQTFAQTSTGSKTLIMTDTGLLSADLVVAEMQNNSGSIIGNSLVYRKSYTAVAMPSAPTLLAASYIFSTNAISATITDFGFVGSDATITVRSVGAGIVGSASAMSSTDSFADFESGELITGNLAYSATTATYSATVSFVTAPKAVIIYASNSYGVSSSITLTDDASSSSDVRTAPEMSAFSLTTTSSTDDGVSITISSVGNQSQGTFSLTINALGSANGSSKLSETFTGVNASTGTVQFVFTKSNMRNVNGWYTAELVGYNSTSSVSTVSNVTS